MLRGDAAKKALACAKVTAKVHRAAKPEEEDEVIHY